MIMKYAAHVGLAQAIETLARGPDPQAWAFVLEIAGTSMERLALRLTGDAALAQDSVQEALLLIRDHAESFHKPPDDADRAARNWILRITVNAALELRRRQNRRLFHQGLAAMQPSKVTPSPDSRLSDDEQRNAVRVELAELPEPTRAAIVLHHCSGLGFSEVAKILGVPEGTAKIRVHRGLAILRQRLIRKGMTCSLLVTANHLENLTAGEVTCLPFTSTPAAQQLLFDPTISTITQPHPGNFIMKTLTMPILATAAAVVVTASLGFLLVSQRSAANDALTPSHASTQPPITPTVTSPNLISDFNLNKATNETRSQTSPIPKHKDQSVNPDQVVLQMYDVSDFLSDIKSDDQKLEAEKDLSVIITQAVSPGSWDNVNCGINIRSGIFFISHRPEVHAQISALLATLRAKKVSSTETPDEQESNAPLETL
jgi:RNA polymerase sigma-70 factor, ECF subfamily